MFTIKNTMTESANIYIYTPRYIWINPGYLILRSRRAMQVCQLLFSAERVSAAFMFLQTSRILRGCSSTEETATSSS